MWNDSDEIFVGSSGQVYFAPVGTPLPALGSDPKAALNKAFLGVGFLTEDGVTPTFGTQVTEIMSWQSSQPTRRNRQTQTYSFAFSMQQWNENNLLLAFGGGEVSQKGEFFSYKFPEDGDALAEWSLVVDAQDGDIHQRFVLARGTVTDDVSSAFKRTQESALPITVKGLTAPVGAPASCYLLSDDPAFNPGS